MDIKEFITYINKLKGKSELEFTLETAVSSSTIYNIEEKLNLKFPEQVKLFYLSCNGLATKHPSLHIYKIENLELDGNLLIFAKFNDTNEVAFDTSQLNNAKQWNIVNAKNKFCITQTMASFWSNKIPAWLKNKRQIWDKEDY